MASVSPLSLAVVWALALCTVATPQHALFQYVKDGVNGGLLESVKDPKLRLNVKGGLLNAGDPLVLWNCGAHGHEIFQLAKNGLIKMASNPNMCLNAEEGGGVGSRIILWPCSDEGSLLDHEQFRISTDGRIKLKQHPDMCLNAKGGLIEHGTTLVLYPCHDEIQPHELFVFDNGLIKSKSKSEFHLNVKGGELTAGAELVLWSCHPGAHEVFEFAKDKTLRLSQRKDLCVNAEEGLQPGHRLVIWPCSKVPGENEQWAYDDARKVVYSPHAPNFGFNVKGAAIQAGTEVVLWQLDGDEEL